MVFVFLTFFSRLLVPVEGAADGWMDACLSAIWYITVRAGRVGLVGFGRLAGWMDG